VTRLRSALARQLATAARGATTRLCLYEKVTGTGPDGPFDRLQVSGAPGAQRLSIGSQPHILYHQVPDLPVVDTPAKP
jgi:hypothetical protein